MATRMSANGHILDYEIPVSKPVEIFTNRFPVYTGGNVPFKSEKQRRFMHAKHPKIAKKWEDEGKRKQGKRSRAKKK